MWESLFAKVEVKKAQRNSCQSGSKKLPVFQQQETLPI
jgi:hypothetical protein